MQHNPTTDVMPDPTGGGTAHEVARERLSRSRVLIVGLGALGTPTALQLASAGVGTLFLIDPDVVELSNLHRQILYGMEDLGTSKVGAAERRLLALYPTLAVETRVARLELGNLSELFAQVDFVVDATDGAEAKFLINDGAISTGRPFSHAGVIGFQGQTMTVVPGQSACFRCLFPEPPPAGSVPSCQEAGIVGPTAGFIASVQACETIRTLLGETPLLANRLLTYDASTRRCRRVDLARNPRCPVCGSRARDSRLEAAGTAGYGS
jgi:molybdopterin/thiamine biosynthesis adenylyltransferase